MRPVATCLTGAQISRYCPTWSSRPSGCYERHIEPYRRARIFFPGGRGTVRPDGQAPPGIRSSAL
jgi:hypothetical protein